MDQKPWDGKAWWKSKTMWISILTASLSLINAWTEAITDPKVLSALLTTSGVLGVVLRLLTTEPIQGSE